MPDTARGAVTVLPGPEDAGTPVPDEIPLPDSFLSRYEIEWLLGSGGLGSVYRARDRSTDTRVAVKFLRGNRDQDSLGRFLQEARIMEQIDHPNVVRLIEADQVGCHPYIVMEFLEGGSLRERIKKGPLGEPETLSLAQDVLSGLEALHRARIVHRDLKPENILLTRWNRAQIADLGVAKDLGLEMERTQIHQMIGTPTYASPEQIQKEPLTPLSDIYSLGVVLHECLTGRPPFDYQSMAQVLHAHIHSAPKPVCDLRPGIRRDVTEIILKALAKEPGDRFPSATAMRRALALTDPRKSRPTPVGPPRSRELVVPPPGRDRRTLLWVVAFALAVTAAFARWNRGTAPVGIAAPPGVASPSVDSPGPPEPGGSPSPGADSWEDALDSARREAAALRRNTALVRYRQALAAVPPAGRGTPAHHQAVQEAARMMMELGLAGEAWDLRRREVPGPARDLLDAEILEGLLRSREAVAILKLQEDKGSLAGGLLGARIAIDEPWLLPEVQDLDRLAPLVLGASGDLTSRFHRMRLAKLVREDRHIEAAALAEQRLAVERPERDRSLTWLLTLIEAAAADREAGRRESAAERLQEARAYLKAHPDLGGPEAARTALEEALLERGMGRLDAALTRLLSAVPLLDPGAGPPSALLIRVQGELVQLRCLAGEYEEARQVLEEGSHLLDRVEASALPWRVGLLACPLADLASSEDGALEARRLRNALSRASLGEFHGWDVLRQGTTAVPGAGTLRVREAWAELHRVRDDDHIADPSALLAGITDAFRVCVKQVLERSVGRIPEEFFEAAAGLALAEGGEDAVTALEEAIRVRWNRQGNPERDLMLPVLLESLGLSMEEGETENREAQAIFATAAQVVGNALGVQHPWAVRLRSQHGVPAPRMGLGRGRPGFPRRLGQGTGGLRAGWLKPGGLLARLRSADGLPAPDRPLREAMPALARLADAPSPRPWYARTSEELLAAPTRDDPLPAPARLVLRGWSPGSAVRVQRLAPHPEDRRPRHAPDPTRSYNIPPDGILLLEEQSPGRWQIEISPAPPFLIHLDPAQEVTLLAPET